MKKFLVVFSVALTLMTLIAVASPAEATYRQRRYRPAFGTVNVVSTSSFDDTWNAVIDTLESNPAIGVVSVIDHAAAAEAAGLELDPNRVVVFGNPNLGTPLMQTNQTVGLDLPQKIQVRQRRNKVVVSYNSPDYLQTRHQLGEVETLETIEAALQKIVANAAERQPFSHRTGSHKTNRFRGLETTASDADVDTTWHRLLSAIEKSPAEVTFTLDHQENAQRVGGNLRPTRLVVFGNPQLGTPLMQRSSSAGIDLPIKILVWEDEHGTTQVTTNSVHFLAWRHRLWSERETLTKVDTAVENFVTAATTSPSLAS